MSQIQARENLVGRGEKEASHPFLTFLNSIKNLGQGIKSSARQKFTIMLIPHADKKIVNFQINTLLLGFLGIVLIGMIVGFFYFAAGTIASNEKSGKDNLNLDQTQSNLDEVLDQVKELLKVYNSFENSMDQTLGTLNITQDGTSSDQISSGDLSRLLEAQEFKEGQLQEVLEIKKLSNALASSIEPLNEITQILRTQKQLLSDIPNYWPVVGSRAAVNMEFGPNVHPITGRWYIHKGFDIAGPIGLPIVASANGKVVEAKYDGVSGYGLVVVIEHKYGFRTRYTHMNTIEVNPGDEVRQGQRIGSLGNTGLTTGPHLHFEVLLGTQVLDPASFLKMTNTFDRWEGNR